jgi:hypothetical protein
MILNYLIDNKTIIFSLCTSGFIAYLLKKYPITQTPISPPNNRVTQGQIQELNLNFDNPERITSPFFMTPAELAAMKEKLERGERLDLLDKVNLDQTVHNLAKFEDYADQLEDLVSSHREELKEITRLIVENLL